MIRINGLEERWRREEPKDGSAPSELMDLVADTYLLPVNLFQTIPESYSGAARGNYVVD